MAGVLRGAQRLPGREDQGDGTQHDRDIHPQPTETDEEGERRQQEVEPQHRVDPVQPSRRALAKHRPGRETSEYDTQDEVDD